MTHRPLFGALALSLFSIAAVPAARATCDLSQTKCAQNGGKCNIKFRNQTAAASGSAGGTDLKQTSSAQTVKVKAVKDNGNSAGNSLTIDAGASNTMNMDKKAKKNFTKIRITSPAMTRVGGVTMSCTDIQAVLNGNGTCKVFHGEPDYGAESLQYQLGYQCDGSNVAGPKD